MKKKILLVMMVLFLCALLSINCFASDVVEDPVLGTSEKETDNTLVSRLGEFWEEYHSVIVTILADAVTIISMVYLLLKNFKKSNAKLDKSQLQSTAVYNSQLKLDGSNKLVEAVASQIAQSSQSMETFVLTEKEKAEQLLNMMLKTQEMLIAIASHIPEMPNQVRDMIDVKYVESINAAKALMNNTTSEVSNGE